MHGTIMVFLAVVPLSVGALGKSEVACSQLCGLGHYRRMRGFYTIRTQADFNASLASQPTGF